MNLRRKLSRRSLLKGAAAGGGALLLGKTGIAGGPGGPDDPSTSVRSYVLPSVPGVQVYPILTTGESADNGYRMAGIPDGLGALADGTTFEVFMNHEIASGSGKVRLHGSNGAFVSKWTIDRSTLHVLKGEDLTKAPGEVHTWNGSGYSTGTTAWNRLCSADLPEDTAFYHGRLGTRERIFMNGEEATFGRAWARIATGPNAGHAWELPRLGKMAFENVVASPHGKEKTIVALFDDGNINPASAASANPCEVFIYIGSKQASGNEIERAGLTNGKFYGVRVSRGSTILTAESNDFGFGDAGTGFIGTASFDLVELGPSGNVSNLTGVQISQAAIDNKVFKMLRVEDGAWDPREKREGDLYFVTTGGINTDTSIGTNSRLWRLRFEDIDSLVKGGQIEILLTGKELPAPGWRMLDNICLDRHGRLLLQEDTGNNRWVARIWAYNVDTRELVEVAHHDPELFQPTSGVGVTPVTGGPLFITQDEESSGIIDAQHIFGRGWFLLDVQNHRASSDTELVEGGQLLALYVHPSIANNGNHSSGHDDED